MAMSIEELEDRINKKKLAIEKIEKRIAKWSKDMNAEAIDVVKVFGDLAYGTAEYKNAFAQYKEYAKNHADDPTVFADSWNSTPNLNELYSAYRDLGDAKLTLAKYQNALDLQQQKSEKPVIQIFKDFFDNWKEEIVDFVRPLVDEYYRINSESADFYNNRWLHLQTMSEKEFKDKCNDYWNQEREISSIPWVRIALDKGFRRNENAFRDYLDKYMLDRYYELVDKVTAITGEIQDVDDLRVGNDGSLNGIIKGALANAKIETIVAGGYNTDRIVNVKHGQCRHYRVLVHKI